MDLITEKEENDIIEKIKFIKNLHDFDEVKFIAYLKKHLSDTEVNKYLSLMENIK